MKLKISSRDKKFLIAGGVAVVLFVVIRFGVFTFYDSYSEKKKEIVFMENTLQRYQNFVEEEEHLQKRLTELTSESGRIDANFLRGDTTSLAASDLQRIIDSVVLQSNVEVQSVRVLDPDDKEEYVKIPLQIIFIADLERLSRFIQGVEASDKLLTIPELRIRVRNIRQPEEILVTVQIAGIMKNKDIRI